MAEPKYVYRPVPCPVFRVEAFQTWLEDMAQRGLFLERDSILLGIATFVPGPARTVRYRLEPVEKTATFLNGNDTPSRSAMELNAQFGWEFVSRYGQFFIYRCDDPAAPELHTDPEIQQWSLKALKKRTRSNLLGGALYCLFFILLRFESIFLPACAFIGTGIMALGVFMVLEGFGYRMFELYHLRRLCTRVRQGQTPTKKADWRRGRQAFRLRSVLSVLILPVWIFLAFTAKPDEVYPVRDYDTPLPFATFSDVYPDREPVLDEQIVESEVLLYSDFLFPQTIEYSWHGNIPFSPTDTAYSILHVNYHQTRSPRLARQLAQSYTRRAKRDTLWPSEDKLIAYDVSAVEADYIFCCNDGPQVLLIVCQGDRMVRCTFWVYGHDTDAEVLRFAQIMADSLKAG